jgi:hypothetical protein
MKDYKQISDRIWYEAQKTFKGIKNPPKFSFLMRCVKLYGEDELVKKLGQLREHKDLKSITNFEPYIMKLFNL